MVTIEQVKQLEERVSKLLDYAGRAKDENTLLKGKLDVYQKRIDELEVLIQRFKEDQGKIEEGIVAALDRLNQFEDSVEKTLSYDKKSKVVSITKSSDQPDVVAPAPVADTPIAAQSPTPAPDAPFAVSPVADPPIAAQLPGSVESARSIDPVADISGGTLSVDYSVPDEVSSSELDIF